MWNGRNTIPKTIYFSEDDMPVFKNRLRAKIVGAIEDVPEECTTIVIPLVRGTDAMATRIGTAVPLALESRLELLINNTIVTSICEVCIHRPACIDHCSGLLSCIKAEIENGFI